MLSKFNKGIKFLFNGKYRWLYLASKGFFEEMPDDVFLKKKYLFITGKELDLENPKRINEKLQWLKIYDRKPEYTVMVDKYLAKEYVSGKIGCEYINPTIAKWNNVNEININNLPNEFVLKCTHDSGGVVLCKNKALFNLDKAKTSIARSMRRNYYYTNREWPYQNVNPGIIAEPMLQNSNGNPLLEYNVFCFNGMPKFISVCSGDRNLGEQRYNDFFDIDGQKLPFRWGFDCSNLRLEMDNVFFDAIEKAKVLSQNTCFLRVDFYVCDSRLIFNELTFYHWAGFKDIIPENWNYKVGEYLELPKL